MKKGKIILYIEALLLILIMNMNVFRIVAACYQINVTLICNLIYGIYIWVILVSKSMERKIKLTKLKIFLMAMVCFIFLEGIIFGNYSQLLKFIVCIIIGCVTLDCDSECILILSKGTYILNFLYAIFLLKNYSVVSGLSKVDHSLNYLTVTLSLGFTLSLLVYPLIMLHKKAFYISYTLFLLYVILHFNARGNVLFPLILFAVSLICMGGLEKKNFIKVGLMIVIVGIFFYYMFIQMKNFHIWDRFQQLFVNLQEEARYTLYTKYIWYLLKRGTWILGKGFGNSKRILNELGSQYRYPHNFILELVGELGVLGIILSISMISYIIKLTYKSTLLFKHIKNETVIQIGNIICGLWYFIMNYFKSYSIYDAYQLFVLLALLSVVYKKVSLNENIYKNVS